MIYKFHEKNLDETPIGSREIFEGELLKVRLDEAKLPDGTISTREYIRHPGAVAIVPILDDGRIVLVKQYRYPLETVMWEIPAGKLDHARENPNECAVRELSEETGYSAEHWRKLISIATTPGFSDEIIHLYKAWGLTAHEQHTDKDEFIDVYAFTLEEIISMIKYGHLFDAKSLCALYACGLLK